MSLRFLALDVGNHVALLHVRSLLGIDFYQFAAKRSGEFKDLSVRVLDVETHGDKRPGTDLYPSDHFPVTATIVLP